MRACKLLRLFYSYLLIFFTFIMGCENSPETKIEFILPDNYYGVFKIVLDKRRGQEIIASDEKVRYSIPFSGVLFVKNVEPLRSWHKAVAKFQNGTVIPIEPPEINTDDIVALRYLVSDSNNQTFFLIGTASDKARFLQNTDRTLGGTHNAK